MSSIKEKCDNYLYTRVYNYINAKKRLKAKLRDLKKFYKFKSILNLINTFKKCSYIDIILGNDVKESFKNLHFLKILKHYVYIKFYHENIKKLNRNERLLNYIEELFKKEKMEYYLNIKIEV